MKGLGNRNWADTGAQGSRMKESIASRYAGRLDEAIRGSTGAKEQARAAEGKKKQQAPTMSSNYAQFKSENLPRHLSLYEKLCNSCGRICRTPTSPTWETTGRRRF